MIGMLVTGGQGMLGREFARAFESFPHDADAIFPGWRQQLTNS